MTDFPAVAFSSYDGMVAAFAAVKNHIGLSNEFCDQVGGLTKGHIDKMLGPARAKNIGPFTFDVLCELLAVEFVPRVNIEAAKRMASRWEKRNRSQIRTMTKPLSHADFDRARSAIFSELGQKGGLARVTKISKRRRVQIARTAGAKGARMRWRQSAALRAVNRKRRIMATGSGTAAPAAIR